MDVNMTGVGDYNFAFSIQKWTQILGTVPERAAVSDSTSSMSITTNVFRSSRYSFILENIFMTNLPDSEKYFEKSEWALISSRMALL